jgi:cysteine-rich repeat protein
VCGDGYKSADEPCDDNNLSNGDGCTAACLPELCGDGIIAAPTESCEDGNDATGDGCGACQLEHLRVFVTVNTFTGDLMSTALADDTCANEASNVKLPGKYLAWLSTVTTDAADRFSAGTLPYKRTDGMTFATSLAALTTNGPQVPLSLTAAGQPLVGLKDSCKNFVWTGTAANGESTPQWTCDNFTSQQLENTGTVGNFEAVNAPWTSACQYPCNQLAHLYCFEQLP